MCVYSVVLDYGTSVPTWTMKGIQSFETLVAEAKKFDEATNQPDCEDPEKVKLLTKLKKLKKKLAKLEKQVGTS